jgi:hypothetical protein
MEMKPEIYWVSFVERQNQEKLLPVLFPPPPPPLQLSPGGENLRRQLPHSRQQILAIRYGGIASFNSIS